MTYRFAGYSDPRKEFRELEASLASDLAVLRFEPVFLGYMPRSSSLVESLHLLPVAPAEGYTVEEVILVTDRDAQRHAQNFWTFQPFYLTSGRVRHALGVARSTETYMIEKDVPIVWGELDQPIAKDGGVLLKVTRENVSAPVLGNVTAQVVLRTG